MSYKALKNNFQLVLVYFYIIVERSFCKELQAIKINKIRIENKLL